MWGGVGGRGQRTAGSESRGAVTGWPVPCTALVQASRDELRQRGKGAADTRRQRTCMCPATTSSGVVSRVQGYPTAPPFRRALPRLQ